MLALLAAAGRHGRDYGERVREPLHARGRPEPHGCAYPLHGAHGGGARRARSCTARGSRRGTCGAERRWRWRGSAGARGETHGGARGADRPRDMTIWKGSFPELGGEGISRVSGAVHWGGLTGGGGHAAAQGNGTNAMGNQPPASGHGFGAAEDDVYETVKPVGYEARLAFERERAAQTGNHRMTYPAGSRPAAPGAGQATARPMQSAGAESASAYVPGERHTACAAGDIQPNTAHRTDASAGPSRTEYHAHDRGAAVCAAEDIQPDTVSCADVATGQAARNTVSMTGAQSPVPPIRYSQVRPAVSMPPVKQASGRMSRTPMTEPRRRSRRKRRNPPFSRFRRTYRRQ